MINIPAVADSSIAHAVLIKLTVNTSTYTIATLMVLSLGMAQLI